MASLGQSYPQLQSEAWIFRCLYLAVEPSEYLGLRWQIKDLQLESEHMRLTQNLEIALATLAYFENQAENN